MRILSTTLALTLTVACAGGDDKTSDTEPTGSSDTEASDTEPQGVDCNMEGDVCVLSGTITTDLELTSDVAWLLRGGVFIGDDTNTTTLTIEAGTTIYGEASTDGMLVIRRNSQIIAEGTEDAPIVFTSSQNVGSRARGDWGGLIINGNASINSCGDGSADCEAYGEGGTGYYGGSDDSDNSGSLEYVRVEFAGTLISPDNELNGIAFQGVGSETNVDFVQVHMNADDGVEFFGGTAFVKHVVTTGVGDDNFDWTDGWRGGAQFVALQQYEGAGDQGIEADNNGDNNEATPVSFPTLSNFTIVGSPSSEKSDIGVLLREGTKADLHNFIVTEFNDAGLMIDHDATFTNADNGELVMTHSIVYNASNYTADEGDGFDPDDVEAWFTGQTGNLTDDPELADPTNEGTPDFQPGSASPALGAGYDMSGDSRFEATDYIGAFDGSNDWASAWIETAQN